VKKIIKKTKIHRDEFFCRNSRVHPFHHKRNEEIQEDLRVEPVDEKLRRYKSNWLHVTRMNNRMPKIMLNYRPNGRRRKTFEENL
jgi:hypothetical protein